MEIEKYPYFVEVDINQRPILHPRFQALTDGISEFTFANLFLFRQKHNYRLSWLSEDILLISGKDENETFFMLPFGLPDKNILTELFMQLGAMKTVPEKHISILSKMGYSVFEDRDNFDYIYSREDLANLQGRKFHKKKNLLNLFEKKNQCQAKPLLEEYRNDAIEVLELWRKQQANEGDYAAAREALENMWTLQLCGGIFYINKKPVAYNLGEELGTKSHFAILFEKALSHEDYKGIYQFINQNFASILPEKYTTINREQDLGVPGLRQAKESYNPVGFVKKYKVRVPS